MIISYISGGLGNQLFQYAFGRTLSISNNCRLKLDISMFISYEWHEFSLMPFNLNCDILSSKDSFSIQSDLASFKNKFNKIIGLDYLKLICEHNYGFSDIYLKTPAPAYIKGYWQSEKYFKSIQDILRFELQISAPPSSDNLQMLRKIESCNSISLHIRRGNYVTNNKVNEIHGVVSIDYYKKALKIFESKIKNPVFFVFSDDIEWAKKNLQLNYEMIFVDINHSKNDYEDLRLMSTCKHHIIANSTFSWWGAWLNKSLEKIVIAPQQWFADSNKNSFTKDLIPNQWLRI